MTRPRSKLLLAVILALLLGCGSSATTVQNDTTTPVAVALTNVNLPVPALKNSLLQADGLGFAAGTLALRLEGTFVPEGGSPVAVNVQLTPTIESNSRVTALLDDNVLTSLGAPTGTFSGTLVADLNAGASSDSIALNFALVKSISPTISSTSTDVWFFGDTVTVTGTNFLIGQEGTSILTLFGTFTRDDDGQANKPQGQVGLIASSRTKATFVFLPGLVGVRAGFFDASVWVENQHSSGASAKSETIQKDLTIARPTFTNVSAFQVSRGKSIFFQGRGLLPIVANVGTDQLTLLRLEGELILDNFDVISFQGDGALLLGFESETLMYSGAEFILRYDDLGSANISGQFRGTITPIVFYNQEQQDGEDFKCNLEGEIPTLCKINIQPQVQVVFTKFLDDFPQALERYGLRNVEDQVREKILGTLRRDYDGISIEFRDTRPTEFVEYSVIELGGVDPNHQDLFGLDNTCSGENGSCKDVGNIRFNDVIGGKNALSVEKGFPSFGGVFVESFFQFSKQKGSELLGNEAFDQIFSCCAPELGGTRVQVGEYPGGSRDELIAEAIRVLGNLIGNTVTHEIGHSLGMTTQGGPDTFHNLIDKPGAIMDRGGDRPFEERAGLDGTEILFRCHNRRYLEDILPKPGAPKGPCIP